MKPQWRILTICSLLIFALAASVQAGEGQVKKFTLKDINGKTFRLEEYIGSKVIYLSFWATWCIPCKTELAIVNDLQQKYKDKDFLVVAISIDDSSTSSGVKSYVQSKQFTFPTLLNPSGDVFFQYNPSKTLPFSLLIDKSGSIFKQYVGFQKGDEVHLEEDIQKTLGKE